MIRRHGVAGRDGNLGEGAGKSARKVCVGKSARGNLPAETRDEKSVWGEKLHGKMFAARN